MWHATLEDEHFGLHTAKGRDEEQNTRNDKCALTSEVGGKDT